MGFQDLLAYNGGWGQNWGGGGAILTPNEFVFSSQPHIIGKRLLVSVYERFSIVSSFFSILTFLKIFVTFLHL